MANQQQLDLLRKGVNAWNTWRKQLREIRPNLSGADLSDIDLNGANLSRTILNRAILIGTDLSGASLNGADLSGASLSGADLSEANLSRANLFRTNLSGANFSGASLFGTKFNNANLSQAIVGMTIFGNLDLRTVKGLETIYHEGPSSIGTDTISRSEGDIPDAFLRKAGLSDTFITYTRSLAQNPIEYYTCFISYSSKDQEFAERLYVDLQNKGVRCWFASEDMKIGDKIRPHIDETIRLYDKLLVVLSEHSITSSWVAYEVEKALNKEPEGIPSVLFPIRLDQAVLTCTTVWAQDIRRTRHIGDFERWKEHDAYQKSLQRLLHALNSAKTKEEK